MSRGHNVARRLASQSRPRRFPPQSTICLPCLLTLRHASTSTASAPPPSPEASHLPFVNPPSTRASASPASQPRTHLLLTSLLLSRPPLLTRDLTPFERAYFLYQRRLNERLSLPFSRYFYYPRSTPQDVAWKRAIRERLTPARDIGKYAAYSEEGWDDEVRVGDQTGERERQMEALVKDAEDFLKRDEVGQEVLGAEAEVAGVEGGSAAHVGGGLGVGKRRNEEVPKPVGRVSEADRTGDQRSLSRKMDRTLYLLVKGQKGWGFPMDGLGGKESLYTAAERILIQSCGLNMNTWIIGNWPVGHQVLTYPQPRPDPAAFTKPRKVLTPSSSTPENTTPSREDTNSPSTTDTTSTTSRPSDSEPPPPTTLVGEKTFFMKARIMAGQANLKDNKFGLKDFKWLAKEEIQKVLDAREWNAVKNCLYER